MCGWNPIIHTGVRQSRGDGFIVCLIIDQGNIHCRCVIQVESIPLERDRLLAVVRGVDRVADLQIRRIFGLLRMEGWSDSQASQEGESTEVHDG